MTPGSWSDAWFLLAVAWRSGSNQTASLVDVIEEGDYLNHAIFTLDEIVHAVNRLRAGGFMAVEGDAFRLTSSGRALVDSAERRTKGAPEVMDRLAIAIDRDVPPDVKSGWSFDPARLDSAVRKYRTNSDEGLLRLRRLERLPVIPRLFYAAVVGVSKLRRFLRDI